MGRPGLRDFAARSTLAALERTALRDASARGRKHDRIADALRFVSRWPRRAISERHHRAGEPCRADPRGFAARPLRAACRLDAGGCPARLDDHHRACTRAIACRGARMKFVVFGLTISSTWGNGHGTLWRGLCKALARQGHSVVFL